jgi:calcineurin-like phosphoesterase family protein
MSNFIRWLHLSDFHVGMDNYGQRKLFREICDHVSQKLCDGFYPDFVFITGDLANKGKISEYTEFFESFLSPLIEVLGNSWNGHILSIPGNHDVDRNRSQFFSRNDILSNARLVFDPTKEAQLAREQLYQRFESYTDMDMTGAPPRWLEGEDGAYTFLKDVRGSRVGIVAINTAWLCKDDHDRHLLTPGMNLLDDAAEKIKDADIKIFLGHHPVDWMEDSHAQQMRIILGKNNAIYLHGHLHVNDVRFDDGGRGNFLGIRCGSAFQGRSEDNPQWVNGLLWAEANLTEGHLDLQPLYWFAPHQEWKTATDAFPNKYQSDGRWLFPLPRRALEVAPKEVERVKPTPSASDSAIKLHPGWALVDGQFLDSRAGEESEERLLQFFDGRPPSWRLAMSTIVPARGLVGQLRSRFRDLDEATKPTVVNLLGAGGEGKSTSFLQTVIQLVREDGWVVLWRHNDLEGIDAETISKFIRTYPRLLVAADEAHSLARDLSGLLARFSGRPSPHFLLCSRSIDWRAEVKEPGSIVARSNYQELVARGIDRPDAELIVGAWAKLGKGGLGALEYVDRGAAADALLDTARNLESEEDEGAFFGAMLRLRYGDRLKDKIRSILYKISDMHESKGLLLHAYAMIAAMHAEGLRFLSLPVLSEYFGMSSSEFRKNIIAPLADEAIAAGGGRFLLCRHKAIAEASLAVLKETNLFGDIDSIYSDLGRAAILARHKGEYVPDLHKWDYHLPKHFLNSGKTLIALSAAEQMQIADPDDIHLRVNLSKLYRETSQPKKAVALFRELNSAVSRAAWHEWAVAERWEGQLYSSIILAAISICDLPGFFPLERISAGMSANTIAINFFDLYEARGSLSYLNAAVAAAKISLSFANAADHGKEIATKILDGAAEYGVFDVPDNDCLKAIKFSVDEIASIIDFDEISKGRVNRSTVSKYTRLGTIFAMRLGNVEA